MTCLLFLWLTQFQVNLYKMFVFLKKSLSLDSEFAFINVLTIFHLSSNYSRIIACIYVTVKNKRKSLNDFFFANKNTSSGRKAATDFVFYNSRRMTQPWNGNGPSSSAKRDNCWGQGVTLMGERRKRLMCMRVESHIQSFLMGICECVVIMVT